MIAGTITKAIAASTGPTVGGSFFSVDNKLLKTFLHLFSKPEAVIVGFIEGTRKKYINVVQYFAIALTLIGLQVFLMEKVFNLLNEHLFGLLRNEEYLTISFSGEHSQFIRFNNALIRQTGLVDDANIGLKFIANGRTCHGAFTVSGNQNIDFQVLYFF